MNEFVYSNGLELYKKAGLPGKIGRVAFECDMTEKLMQLGYATFNGIKLVDHLKEAEEKYKELTKQLKQLQGKSNTLK